MCRYCDNRYDHAVGERQLLDAADVDAGWQIKLWLYKQHLMVGVNLYHGGYGDENITRIDTNLDINYCPMCGETLLEEGE